LPDLDPVEIEIKPEDLAARSPADIRARPGVHAHPDQRRGESQTEGTENSAITR
jgi:hypothetical protein